MKSSKESLKSRGMFEDCDLAKFKYMTKEMLLEYINSEIPHIRSSAIHELMKRFKDNATITMILERLKVESALYTRLEICNSLEQGDDNVAKQMIDYLGMIGENQYIKLPDKVSKKISYPLPRDIIARSLGRMNPTILPVLLSVLESEEEQKIMEVMDAIGYLLFYNEHLATSQNIIFILNAINQFRDNQVIVWKTTTCLSAFSLKESISKLNQIKIEYHNSVIAKEAERSLEIIQKRCTAISMLPQVFFEKQ
ncbi:MAG: hypothetical protein ACERKZ_00790 [Lachnotalea sp.]